MNSWLLINPLFLSANAQSLTGTVLGPVLALVDITPVMFAPNRL
jgi:hypothetical protein